MKVFLATSRTTRHIVAVTKGRIFDGNTVVALTLEGMKLLAITNIVEGRRIVGGITKNAKLHANAALTAARISTPHAFM